MSATSKPEIPVNEINTPMEEQVTPFIGVICPPPVAEADLVSESNVLTADTGIEQELTEDKAFQEPERFILTLDAKLEAVRQIGCNAGQVWREGQLEILVNGLFMSVESFMDRSLSSFKEILPATV